MFSGSEVGIQIGQDLFADETPSGHRNHYGLYFSYARASGDVSGFALGFPDYAAGTLAIHAYSIAGYWTHIGPSGWYVDSVLQGSTLTADAHSHRGIGDSTHGTAITASIEAGMPFRLATNLSVEPQLQLVWQHMNVNSIQDAVSTVSFDNANAVLFRAGVRVESKFENKGVVWWPYLRASMLRASGGTDQAIFAGATALGTSLSSTAAQFGGGVVATLGGASLYATVSYVSNLDGARRNTLFGNLGVRWRW